MVLNFLFESFKGWLTTFFLQAERMQCKQFCAAILLLTVFNITELISFSNYFTLLLDQVVLLSLKHDHLGTILPP